MASIIDAYPADGTWRGFVEQSGQYEVELRRWPIETDRAISDYKGLGASVPMREFSEDAVPISPVTARVTIQQEDISKKIDPDEPSVRFQITLNEGQADLHAWFIDEDGTKRAAYFIYVKRISG